MIPGWRKFFDLAGRNSVNGLIILAAMGVFSSVLELASIGLIYPLITSLIDPGALPRLPLVGYFFQDVSNSGQSVVATLMLAIVFVVALKNAFLVVFTWVQVWLTGRLRLDVAHKLITSYLHGEYPLHLNRNSAEPIRNISAIALTGIGSYFIGLSSLIADLIVLFTLVAMLVIVQPMAIFAAAIVIGGALLLQRKVFRSIVDRIAKDSVDLAGQLQHTLMQCFGAINETIVGVREDYFQSEFDELAIRVVNNARRHEFVTRMPHTYPLNSGGCCLICGKPAAARGVVDDRAHCQRLVLHETGNDPRSDAADALGLAPIVPENELNEIGLQMLVAHRPRMSAQQPAFQKRNRPVAALQSVLFTPLVF